MADTVNLGLPLLAAAQSQKHVTVNEALSRLDSLAQVSAVSASVAVPPGTAQEGDLYLVPAGATAAWSGHAGEVAFWLNGGWEFAPPREGWIAFDRASGQHLTWRAGTWTALSVTRGANGAETRQVVEEFVDTLTAGPQFTGTARIRTNALVLCVSARVVQAITGTLSTWSLGVSGATSRYGSGLGTGAGSYALGVTGSPVAYYSDTPLVFTAVGGAIGAGQVRTAVHYLAFSPSP